MSKTVAEAAKMVQFSRSYQNEINLRQARERFAAVVAALETRRAVAAFVNTL